MDINRIALIEKENRNFIRYSLVPEETVSKTELETLKNNKIQGILDILEVQNDNEVVFLYNVTSKIQLLQRFTMPFSGEQVFKILQSLCKLWICTDEYMLDRKHFMTYPELMCVDQDTSELYVMVLPIYAENDKEMEFYRILIGILEHIFYKDETIPNFLLKLKEYVGDHISLTARTFLDALEKIYQTEQGVLQPISETPDIPEHSMKDEKKIIQEEAVKEALQSRFHAQNDEMKFQNYSFKEEKDSFVSPTGISLPIKEKKAEKATPFGVPPVPIREKNKEKKPKIEKEKKVKEKKVKEKKYKKKEAVPMPIQSVPKKEEKQRKEKKGWFHGFGFGKKKEIMEEEQPEEQENLIPVTEINKRRISPIEENGMIGEEEKEWIEKSEKKKEIDNGIPIGKDINAWQGMQGNFNSNQQIYKAWSLHSEIENNLDIQSQEQKYWKQNFEKPDIQKQQEIPFSKEPLINNNSISLSVQKEVLVQKELPIQEGLDLDATMLLDGSMDLDATILMNPEEKKEVFIPVLRSRETGELIKITHTGFLVGRQKIRDGKVIDYPEVRQPDLILPLNKISHSHAEFIEKEGQWYLLDCASLNGTYINEKKLTPQQEQVLQEGDILRFASEEYEYLIITE